MSIASAIVLFAVVWFLTLLVALPIGIRTQEEDGSVVPGTPSSAPAVHLLRRKLIWTTAISLLIWAALCATILWGGISMRDLDIWGRM